MDGKSALPAVVAADALPAHQPFLLCQWHLAFPWTNWFPPLAVVQVGI